jgi:hypothetical protein
VLGCHVALRCPVFVKNHGYQGLYHNVHIPHKCFIMDQYKYLFFIARESVKFFSVSMTYAYELDPTKNTKICKEKMEFFFFS